MSQLVQLRQRISTIETIKKITHAMRLTAMSGHSRLRTKQEPLTQYQKTVQSLFARIHAHLATYPSFLSPDPTNSSELIILIGSQKGLCGNFNNALFAKFEQEMRTRSDDQQLTYITVGKKAVEYLTIRKKTSCLEAFNILTLKTLPSIAQKIIAIITAKKSFTKVTVLSNQFKTFFLQLPQATQFLPATPNTVAQETPIQEKHDYIWEQDPEEIAHTLAQLYITSSLEDLLFQSLLAEQAARFISMDNATRNAEQLLEKNKLDYNKLRQAKITKELTEITGSM